MKLIVCVIALSVILGACKKNNENDLPRRIDGSYSGTFNRTGMDTADVKLSFGENLYEGQSDMEKYPAICRGSFNLSQNLIVFADSCTWTANFDWTLILNGTYNISFQDNDAIRIWRTNGNITDEYLLRRMFR